MRTSLGTLSLALAALSVWTPAVSAGPAEQPAPTASLAEAAHAAGSLQTAQAAPNVPPPEAYSPEQPAYEEVTDTYNAPMFTSGALVFAASYGASAIVASQDGGRGNNRLYVPVVGPWLALGDRGACDPTKTSCDHETTTKILLIADGLFQAAGLIGMIDSVIRPTTHRVVSRSARRDPTKLRIAPTMTHGNPGLAAIGKF